MTIRRMLRILGAVAAAVFACGGAAAAHPLGNFTINHLTRIVVGRDAVTLRYVLDQAEIPTFSLDRALDPHGTPSRAALAAWATSHAAAILPQLVLRIDGRPVALAPGATTVVQRPGAGGLPTLYFTATYTAPLAPGAHRIVYDDATEAGRIGWKDVVTGAQREPTSELRSYPSALLGSPRERTALVADIDARGAIRPVAGAAGETAAADAGGVASPGLGRMNALAGVLARGAAGPLVVLGALVLAIGLGALHAFEPGHGKTLLAVSLVGARATTRQALVLASALTVAHTAGVLAFGVIVLAAAQWIVPDQIYPWITLASGVIVTIIGGRALAREIRRRLPIAHEHPHAHSLAHPHAHDHRHTPGDHHHAHHDDAAHAAAHAIPGTAPLTFRSAVLAAVSGNIAPCPAALVVLLAAVALHQVGYGLVLIVAFSVGLAAVLTILGIAVVRSAAWLVARPSFDRVTRFAPLVTASVIALAGSVMVGEGFAAAGIGSVPVPVVAALVLAAIVGYALAWHQHRQPARATV